MACRINEISPTGPRVTIICNNAQIFNMRGPSMPKCLLRFVSIYMAIMSQRLVWHWLLRWWINLKNMYSCSIVYIEQIKCVPVEVNDMHYMNSFFVYMKIHISLAICMCAKSLVVGYRKTELWYKFMVYIMRLVERLCWPWLHICNRAVNRMIAPVPNDHPSRIWVSRYIYHLAQPRIRNANKTKRSKTACMFCGIYGLSPKYFYSAASISLVSSGAIPQSDAAIKYYHVEPGNCRGC